MADEPAAAPLPATPTAILPKNGLIPVDPTLLALPGTPIPPLPEPEATCFLGVPATEEEGKLRGGEDDRAGC